MLGIESFSLTEILVILTVVLLTALWLSKKDGRKLPSGPLNLPIVGYMPFLKYKPYVKLQELSKIYGPVFSIKLGSQYTIVLNDYQSIKEAYSKDSFIGRPPNNLFEISKETFGRQVFDGILWKEQRKFTKHLLRDLGLGKSKMEQFIREEICELIDRLKTEVGNDVRMVRLLMPSMSNNIASLCFGKRKRYDDPKRIQLDKLLLQFEAAIGSASWLSFFPWLKPILILLGMTKQKELSQSIKALSDYMEEEVQEHKKTFDPNNIRDFIDGYMVEIERRKDDKDTTFIIPILKDLVRMLFGAGSQTVKITMDWLLILCAAKQDVQKKIHEEIDEIIGKDQFPSKEEHQTRMPYTTAVIMELMRWRTIIPLNLFRYTIEDTQLLSFDIPKHTCVWANLWAVAHDPKIWGPDAESFMPERFLTEDRKGIKKTEHSIPFSIGKRSCIGEPLANMEIFMYLTGLLQKFHFRLPEGRTADFDGQLGIVMSPKPQELQFRLRL